jgi:c(7)-type cytochrome triheme protein
MNLRVLLIAILLIALPAALFARGIPDRVSIGSNATGPVEFSHNNHLQAVGKNCPSCHNEIFHILPGKNTHYNMAEMEQGKSCGACHNGTRAFSVKADCANCHPNPELKFATDAGDAPFSHKVHTGLFGCGECHPRIFIPQKGKNSATMAQMEKGKSCGACHDGSSAFTVKENCDTCHEM